MDHNTQQNAALVEESAAAAASLKEQAQRLVQAVAVFRLERGAERSAGRSSAGSDTAGTASVADRLKARPEAVRSSAAAAATTTIDAIRKRASGRARPVEGKATAEATDAAGDWQSF